MIDNDSDNEVILTTATDMFPNKQANLEFDYIMAIATRISKQFPDHFDVIFFLYGSNYI